MKFEYIAQPSPDGIAQAFIIGKDFIGEDDVCLILGDNIYYGQGMTHILSNAILNVSANKMATIFGYHVNTKIFENFSLLNESHSLKIILAENI